MTFTWGRVLELGGYMQRKQIVISVASALCVVSWSMSPAWAEDSASGTDSSSTSAGSTTPQPSSATAVMNEANAITSNAEGAGIPVSSSRTKYPLRFGGVDVYADVAADYGYDDNVTQASSSVYSSSFLSVRPTIAAQIQSRADTYSLTYRGDYRRFPDYDPNNTNSSGLFFAAQNVFTGRTKLDWAASVADVQDPLGSTDRSSSGSTPDHHRDMALNGTFAYGAEDARGRLEFDAGVGSKRFLNNHASTESSDVDNTNVAARFLYRVAPKTHVLTEVSRTSYDYQHDTDELTNQDYRYSVGAKWEATAATTGTIKVGEQQKNYDASSRNDYTGFSWEASIRWQPLSYSTVDFLSGRSATDPSGTETAYQLTQNNSITWNHDWTNYVHSKLAGQFNRSNYVGSDRHDRVNIYTVGMMYDMRRWLGLGMEYAYSRRHSTTESYNYMRHLMMFKVEASF